MTNSPSLTETKEERNKEEDSFSRRIHKSSESIPIRISLDSKGSESLERNASSSLPSRKNSISQSLTGFSFFNRDSSPSNIKQNLLYFIERGDWESVSQRLKREEEQVTEEHWKSAVIGNHYRVVSVLLEESDILPCVDRNWAIKYSCKLGYESIVKVLLNDKRIDPSEGQSWAEKNESLLSAAKMGHHRIVEMLLCHPKVDPSVDGCKALIDAVSQGHYDVVKVLLSDRRIDPCCSGQFSWEKGNDALRIAQQKGYRNIIQLLLNDSRVTEQEREERRSCSEQALGKTKNLPFESPEIPKRWGY